MKIKKSAVTIAELIISTLIVSMVVVGVFSADYALRRMGESGARDVTVNIQTRSVAESVRDSVRKVLGALVQPLTSDETGIDISTATKTICFRHDVQDGTGQFTPANNADDNWTCYTQIGTVVHRCEQLVAAACVAADPSVGSLVSDQFTHATILALGPVVTSNPVTGEYFFEMTFVGRQDPSAGAAFTAGSLSSGTDTNPQTVIKIRENAAGF